jgi:hypothetical protein
VLAPQRAIAGGGQAEDGEESPEAEPAGLAEPQAQAEHEYRRERGARAEAKAGQALVLALGVFRRHAEVEGERARRVVQFPDGVDGDRRGD